MDEALCLTCGAPAPALTGTGWTFLASDTDVLSLVYLFEKQFDTATCEAGHPLDVKPTVMVVFRDPNVVLLAPGSKFEDMTAEEFAAWKDKDGSLEVLPSLDDLRNAVAQRLIDRVKATQPLFEARTQGTLADYVRTHWKSLTPEIFAALRVALTGIVPGLLIGMRNMDGTMPPSEELLTPFSDAQALVWLGLFSSWLVGDDQGQTLEEELQRFVDESPVIEGAAERLFTWFDHLTKPEMMFHSRFCLESVRASLCATQKCSNPQAYIWAELFFEQELALRRQDDALPPKIRAMTISEERARKTISIAEAQRVVSRRLNDLFDSEPDLVRRMEQAGLLREVAAKAGHDDLFDSIADEVQLDIPAEDLADYLIAKLGDPPPHLGPVATVFQYGHWLNHLLKPAGLMTSNGLRMQ